ncbi:ABC transporter ATP-binding protein [Shewanella corallii]|uniref:ABC transporter ATP-binding protein n=2 Tax=Shewanella TaxID=22 RepID=A0ABT0N6U6_9GAMM|nr:MULTISPECIES: ABC transporter ATP-binding protein [Shewanella]MCL1037118.1 ABC transporter ATP-binding protein [Shewanella submarina]MCL2913606.1 ABC transporter ATP-binding protein [Shewanella corallii]
MTALSITGVNSEYQGVRVLDGLDLQMEQGEILALLGPSGCGKTTLLRAIAGLQPVSSGCIHVQGQCFNGEGNFTPSEQRGVGMIFQDYALFPHLTVADNILFGVTEKDSFRRGALLEEMLTLVKLEGLEKRYPHELSGGQQQRVSIARALACKPKLLLLDEPFSNIDSQVRGELMMEIRAILKSRKVSAVFVTHSKDEAFVFADKLALFKEGRIVQHGTAEELYYSPAERYVADFLGRGNYVPVQVVDGFNVDSPLGQLVSTSELTWPSQYSGEVLLRPQQLTLEPDDAAAGVIRDRRFLGNFCHYQVEIASQLLEVRSQLTQLLPGQKVQIRAEAHPLVIF